VTASSLVGAVSGWSRANPMGRGGGGTLPCGWESYEVRNGGGMDHHTGDRGAQGMAGRRRVGAGVMGRCRSTRVGCPLRPLASKRGGAATPTRSARDAAPTRRHVDRARAHPLLRPHVGPAQIQLPSRASRRCLLLFPHRELRQFGTNWCGQYLMDLSL
jgi:hypothetical protein